MQQTPIARTILIGSDTNGKPIREMSAPIVRVPVENFLAWVFRRRHIEYLGRSTMVQVSKLPLGSSLFFQSMNRAYADHHAFGLRPEMLMYLINSVIAETVKRHPDEYRHLFTNTDEYVAIRVRHDGLVRGNPQSPWHEAIPLFYGELEKRVPRGIMDDMLPWMSTASQESHIASLVAFMEAASPYYAFTMQTSCGIPRVVLFGEADDYRRLVSAASALASKFEKHLGSYFNHLLPILETIAVTAETGEYDVKFWSQMYKQTQGSGTKRFSGWISSFLWYVTGIQRGSKTSTLEVKNPQMIDWRSIEPRDGIESGAEPSHVSSTPFAWDYYGDVYPMSLIGGVLGVDVVDGALTPKLSFGVLCA